MKASQITKWYQEQLVKGLTEKQIEKEFDKLIKSKENGKM